MVHAAGKRRMMHCDEHRAGEVIALRAGERGLEKRKLTVVQRGARVAFGGDDAGIFKRVAVEPQQPDEGRFQRVVDAGLDHRGARQATSFIGVHGCCGAEVTQIGIKRGNCFFRIGHAIVIAGDARMGAG